MIIVPKWDEWNDQRKLTSHFKKVLDTNSRMTDSKAESNWMVPKARKSLETELSNINRWRIEQKVIRLETSKTND